MVLKESKLYHLYYITIEIWGKTISYSFYYKNMKEAIKLMHTSIDFNGMAAILEDGDKDTYYKLIVINDKGDTALEATIQRLNHCKYI